MMMGGFKVEGAALVLNIALLMAVVLNGTQASLLPWMEEPPRSLLPELLLDPFRILEQVPFSALEKGDDIWANSARVDWKETPEGHQISIEVPGMKKDEIKIEVEENRVLRVSGERKREEEQKGDHWHRTERSYGKFWRRFRLPDNVDLDSVKAELKDGLLSINLPKLSPQKIKGPKTVMIQDGTTTEDVAKISVAHDGKQEL